MRFLAILLVVSLLHCLHAAVIDEGQRWTLRDTEEDDAPDTDYASGEESLSENSWVTYSRGGDGGGVEAQPATVDQVDSLEQYLSTRPDIFTAGPKSRLESYAGEQMEDGPEKIDTIDRVNPKTPLPREDGLPVAGIVLDAVTSANFYPEFAVGLLENGCAAFLIGPRHALTAAHCVYDSAEGTVKEGLDMWRGRNVHSFLEHMLWTEVIVPKRYLLSAEDKDNWALIVYSRSSRSSVWLKFGFSENIYNVPYTIFGYLSSQEFGVMYSTVCRSGGEGSETEDEQLLNVQCGSDECFDGGPLLRGYDFKHSKMPVAYGVSFSECNSYSFRHNNVVFQPDLFWTLCYLLSDSGFNAQCEIKNT